MGTKYDQLSLEERCEVARLHGTGCSIRQIAAALDRSASSISRELKRNRGQQIGYKPVHAQERAKARRWKGSKLQRNEALREEPEIADHPSQQAGIKFFYNGPTLGRNP